MQEFPEIVTASLAKQISQSLRQMIESGQLRVDERLPAEEELAAQFGVSRATIREALKRLAASNLIRSRRGPSGGNFVTLPRPEEVAGSLANVLRLLAGLGRLSIEDIIEARIEIGTMCCRLAASRRTYKHLEAMREELELQRGADLSDMEFCDSDVRFHRMLAEATQNSLLNIVSLAVSDALQPITNLIVFRFRDRQIVVGQHERVLASLERGEHAAGIEALEEQGKYLYKMHKKALESMEKKTSVTSPEWTKLA